MSKRADFALTFLFCAYLGGFFLANILSPDRDFSPQENRELQTFPQFSLSSLFRGEFTSKVEDYGSDQFVFRDRWIECKARLELLQGKRSNNGIFLCAGQRLLEPFTAPAADELTKKIGYVETLAENVDVPVTLGLIPSAAELYGDLLPAGVKNDSQTQVLAAVKPETSAQLVDITSPLQEHREEYIFYRTDHHWTSLGAYYGYRALGDALGYAPRDLESYSPETVSRDFCGTAYSSSGFFWVEPDEMLTFAAAPESVSVDRFDSSAGTSAPLYDYDMLSTKDKYRFFLGGNTPRAVVHTGQEDLPSLLILRDSYTDSLAPFLLEHFSQIHLLDLRYYRESISDYVAANDIDSVLVLYGLPNFCEDSNLAMMTR